MAVTPVSDRTEKNLKALKKAGVPENERSKYISSSGYMDDDGKAICKAKNVTNFEGAPRTSPSVTYRSEYHGSNTDEYIESIGDMPEIYDDTAYQAEIAELDKTIDGLDKLIDNPLLLGAGVAIGAEIIPLARFLKPVKDLFNDDLPKAAVGTATRGVDILLSPLKLFLAGSQSLVWGVLGLATGDKDFGFVNGFTDFYKTWAQGRDEVEDEILGRKTKSELVKEKQEKLQKIREEAIQEREKKIHEMNRQKAEHIEKQQQIAIKKQQEREEQKRLAEIRIAEENYRREEEQRKRAEELRYQEERKLVELGKGDKYLGQERKYFAELLSRLKRIKPEADSYKYRNYQTWSSDKLAKNARKIEFEIACYQRAKGLNVEPVEHFSLKHDALQLAKLQEEFPNLLLEYASLKRNADLSKFDNWRNWGLSKLTKNANYIRKCIFYAKLRNKK